MTNFMIVTSFPWFFQCRQKMTNFELILGEQGQNESLYTLLHKLR